MVRLVRTCMNRITLSCNDVTANELEWLSTRTMRKPSNLFAVLLSQEVQRHLDTMPEDERSKVYEQLTGSRVVSLF
jgi:hypothetical protein